MFELCMAILPSLLSSEVSSTYNMECSEYALFQTWLPQSEVCTLRFLDPTFLAGLCQFWDLTLGWWRSCKSLDMWIPAVFYPIHPEMLKYLGKCVFTFLTLCSMHIYYCDAMSPLCTAGVHRKSILRKQGLCLQTESRCICCAYTYVGGCVAGTAGVCVWALDVVTLAGMKVELDAHNPPSP